MQDAGNSLSDWRERALAFEANIKKAVIGQDRAIRLIAIAVFARGHVLLEGDVGVGKTALLRAVARALGGAYERIEGTIDLMPADLIYYTYINREGRPQVDPGPVLKHGEALATFFFNEINRARPQVHSLLLRIMAERSVTAFNREYVFPHLQVYADRNRVEKEETFELPAAARDRFFMEIPIEAPADPEMRKALAFDPRFHDVDRLIESVAPAVLPHDQLNAFAAFLQQQIQASPALQNYALEIWRATRSPQDFSIQLDGIDTKDLVQGGASPRGVSALIRAARVNAWFKGREIIVPEDVQDVYHEIMAHRVFFNPVYEYRRGEIARGFSRAVLNSVAAP